MALGLVIVGCSSDDSGSGSGGGSAAELTSTSWVLSDKTDLGVPSRNVAVTAEFASGRITGNSGCNSYTGSFTLDGDEITIDPDIASTRMACEPGPMTVEDAYLKRLPRVETYEITGDTLTLRRDGEALLVYTASAGGDAIAGEWTAINYYTGSAVQSVLAGSPPTARFDRGQVTGDASCNNFNGPYEVTGKAITMGPFASTLMACVDEARQTQEQQYLAALELARSFVVTGNRLELRRAGGEIAVMFEKGAATG